MIQSRIKQSREPLIKMSLRHESMMDHFPSDPNSDVTLILSSTRKNYRLQKKYLRVHSQYFKDYFNDERTCDSNIMLITQKFEPRVFDLVLGLIYGGVYEVPNDQEFYTAFLICQYLKLDSLLLRMETIMVEEFSRFSFIILYQLAEMFQLMSVKSRCLDYVESDMHSWRRTIYLQLLLGIFDFNQIQCHYIKTKQLFGCARDTTNKAPTNILLLNEETFKNLIKVHNEYKQVQLHAEFLLPYEEIYKILKLYVEVRTTNSDESKELLRPLVIELIDKNWLTAKQYRCIYHQELLNQVPGVPAESFDSLGRSTKKGRDIFDPLVSENYLNAKELSETRIENDNLALELRKARETLEQSVKQSSKLQQDLMRSQSSQDERDRQYRDKMAQMERDLVTTKLKLSRTEKLLNDRDRLVAELQMKLDQAYSMQHEELDATVESELHLAKTSMQRSQIIEYEPPRRASITSARQSFQRFSLSGKLIQYDQNPRCVINSRQLDCLLEFFQPSIFEKINMKLLYRRYPFISQDGSDPATLIKHCRFQSDITIFFRTEHEKVFGLYLNHEILKLEETFTDQKAFLFSVTHGRKLKQVNQAVFVFDRNSIALGKDLRIMADQSLCEYPVDFESDDWGPEMLAGDAVFQLTEIEAYKINVSRAMDMI